MPYVVSWPYSPDSVRTGTQPERIVPDVTGRSLRAAARTLHRSGFHVVVKGIAGGVIHHTWPAAGDRVAAGSTVTIFVEPPPTSYR